MRTLLVTALFCGASLGTLSAQGLGGAAGMQDTKKPAPSVTKPIGPAAVSNAAAGSAKTTEPTKPEAKPEAKPEEKKAEAAKSAAKPDDAALTAAVKEKLAAVPSLKGSAIGVTVSNGVATLTGTLKNAGLKGVATNMAKKVKGVTSVNNQITVEKGKK
jgi:hypothetical protein